MPICVAPGIAAQHYVDVRAHNSSLRGREKPKSRLLHSSIYTWGKRTSRFVQFNPEAMFSNKTAKLQKRQRKSDNGKMTRKQRQGQ
jgi:hypothetical protein